MEDLRIDIYRNSVIPHPKYKHGIDTIRITHMLTGTAVICDTSCQRHAGDEIIDARACAMKKLNDKLNS